MGGHLAISHDRFTADIANAGAAIAAPPSPSHACGQCDYCQASRLNLCRHMRFPGSASAFPHVQSMFREHFVICERQLTPVDEDISLGELACAEPLSIGLHAVYPAGSLTGKTVLVTGGGTIGCMSVLAARLAGAARIICCDIAGRLLAMATQVGADRIVRSDRAGRTAFADIADICIEAAGSPAALATCLEATRKGGRIVLVGILPTEVMFPANSIMARELDNVGAFRAAQAFDWAVQFVRTRQVDVRPLLSAQISLKPLARSLRVRSRPHAQHQGANDRRLNTTDMSPEETTS